jgi:hypothetical protein
MQDIQDVYNRIQEKKKERKRYKLILKDAFAESLKLKEAMDAFKAAQAKKKSIEQEILREYPSEKTALENLENDIKADQELMDDIALSMAMRGETVTIKDERDKEYQSILTVKYKMVR